MKYTKTQVQNLDAQTLDFCARWVWDAFRRHKMTEGIQKTKAQREYSQAFGHGLEFGFDMLRKLKQYNDGSAEMAQEFALLDDNIKE